MPVAVVAAMPAARAGARSKEAVRMGRRTGGLSAFRRQPALLKGLK